MFERTNQTVVGSKRWLIHFYQEQLDYFLKVGLGNRTTHDVKVTPILIKCTKKRLEQLTTVYDARLTPQAIKLRRARDYRLKKEKLLNGSTNGNGTIAAQSGKDNSNIGHARDKS